MIYNMFKSWVAGAMGVKFLAQGNNSGSKSQLGTSTVSRPVPYHLGYHCPQLWTK